MKRYSLLQAVFTVVLLILALHFAAIVFYFYWSIWWYDILLHLLGGIFASLLILWISFFSGYIKMPSFSSWWQYLFFALLATFAIGVLWEIFEFLLSTSYAPEGYGIDTSVDLLMDIAGSIGGYLFFTIAGYEKTLLQSNL